MNEKVGYLSVALMTIGFISNEWVGGTVASLLVLGGAAIGSLNVLYPFALALHKARKHTSEKEKQFDVMISLMCRINGLGRQYELKMYTQRSPSHARFNHRTYVGDVFMGDIRRGLVIDIDERLERPAGFVCENPLAPVRDEVYASFVKFEREWRIGSVFADHFRDHVTGKKTKLEWLQDKTQSL
jgi:hypothetical protein